MLFETVLVFDATKILPVSSKEARDIGLRKLRRNAESSPLVSAPVFSTPYSVQAFDMSCRLIYKCREGYGVPGRQSKVEVHLQSCSFMFEPVGSQARVSAHDFVRPIVFSKEHNLATLRSSSCQDFY